MANPLRTKHVLQIIPLDIIYRGQHRVMTPIIADFAERLARLFPGMANAAGEGKLAINSHLVIRREPYDLDGYIAKTGQGPGEWSDGGEWLHKEVGIPSLAAPYGSSQYDGVIIHVSTSQLYAKGISGLTVTGWSYVQSSEGGVEGLYRSGKLAGVVLHEYLHQIEREHEHAGAPFPFTLHDAELNGFHDDPVREWFDWYDYWIDHAHWDVIPEKPAPTPHPDAEVLPVLPFDPDHMWETVIPGMPPVPVNHLSTPLPPRPPRVPPTPPTPTPPEPVQPPVPPEESQPPTSRPPRPPRVPPTPAPPKPPVEPEPPATRPPRSRSGDDVVAPPATVPSEPNPPRERRPRRRR